MPETSPRPEDLYCKADTERERLRLRTGVLVAYGGHIRAAARRLVPRRYVDEACQEGIVGLLDALEKYEPGRNGPDRGAAFWAYAALYVRNAIQGFRQERIDWAPQPDRGTGERAAKRAASNERLRNARRFEPLDDSGCAGDEDLNPENLVCEAERQAAVSQWLAQLDPADRDHLFREDGRHSRSSHYLSLVEEARAQVNAPARRGKDGSASSLRCSTDTVRP